MRHATRTVLVSHSSHTAAALSQLSFIYLLLLKSYTHLGEGQSRSTKTVANFGTIYIYIYDSKRIQGAFQNSFGLTAAGFPLLGGVFDFGVWPSNSARSCTVRAWSLSTECRFPWKRFSSEKNVGRWFPSTPEARLPLEVRPKEVSSVSNIKQHAYTRSVLKRQNIDGTEEIEGGYSLF